MITDKYTVKRSLSDAKQSNSCSPISNLLDKPSVLQHRAVWLIIIKFIKQKWTLQECFKNKHPKWSRSDQEAQRNFANGKSPFLNQQFWRSWKSLSHIFPDFPLEETRHTSPNLDWERSAKHRYSSNMAEHDPSHISSLTILDHAKKGQTPTLNLPSFQNILLISIFFQIWRFSFWRLFSIGGSIARFERLD
jgi:hypothetical protein